MLKCFISYRRQRWTGPRLLNDSLKSKFGADSTFFDIDGIPVGDRFPGIIAQSIKQSHVIFVVIDDEWLVEKDGQRRLNNPEDWVRREIEIALGLQIPIIPLLLERARMPGADELPKSLAEFVQFQSVKLRNEDYQGDLERIIQRVERLTQEQRETDDIIAQLQGPLKRGNWLEIHKLLTNMVAKWTHDGRRSVPQRIARRMAMAESLLRAREAFEQGQYVTARDLLSALPPDGLPRNVAFSLRCAELGAEAMTAFGSGGTDKIAGIGTAYTELKASTIAEGLEIVPGLDEVGRLLSAGQNEMRYRLALSACESGQPWRARSLLASLGDFRDSQKLAATCDAWTTFFRRVRNREWDEARAVLGALTDKADAQQVQRWRRWCNSIRRCIEALDAMGQGHVLVAPGVPCEAGTCPYTVLGVAPSASGKEILDLSFKLQERPGGIEQRERNACDALRLPDKRLVVDFCSFRVENPERARKLADELVTVTEDIDGSRVLALFGDPQGKAQDGQGGRSPTRQIADRLGADGPILLFLMGILEGAMADLEALSRAAPENPQFMHHMGLIAATRIYAPVEELADPSSVWEALVTAWAATFANEAFWHQWWVDRKAVYQVSEVQIAEARQRIHRFWTDQIRTAEASFDVPLRFHTECSGASAVQDGGGIPLPGREGRAVVGAAGATLLSLNSAVADWAADFTPNCLDVSGWQQRVCHYFSELAQVAALTELGRHNQALDLISGMRKSARRNFEEANPAFAQMPNRDARLNQALRAIEQEALHSLAIRLVDDTPPRIHEAIEQWKSAAKIARERGQEEGLVAELQRVVLRRAAALRADDTGEIIEHLNAAVAIVEAVRDAGWDSEDMTDAFAHILLDRGVYAANVHSNHEAARHDALRAWNLAPGTLRALRSHYAASVSLARDLHYVGRRAQAEELIKEAADLYAYGAKYFPDDPDMADWKGSYDRVTDLLSGKALEAVKGAAGPLNASANMYAQALIHEAHQEFPQAIKIYKELLRQDPGNSNTEMKLAQNYRNLIFAKIEAKDSKDEVRELVMEALRNCPNSELLKDMREAVEADK